MMKARCWRRASADPFEQCRGLAQQPLRHCRVPTLAEAGWDVWERLAALEPADANKGTNGAGHLEAGLKDMTAAAGAAQPPAGELHSSVAAPASRPSQHCALASMGKTSLAP